MPITITTALRTFFEPGDVFEIRVLDAVSPGSTWTHNESGYFEYDQIDIVQNCLDNFASYGGVYVTMNPVNPDLLARAANRLKPAKRNESTKDGDVLQRRWMLVDVDPVRPAGIGATDQEKDFSRELAKTIDTRHRAAGWPEPMVVDSGNGTQLLYRVDLPNNDDGLVRRCLNALAIHSTEEAHVDQSVHNAARICRLPGTKNCKGDHLEERPHRMAGILHLPEIIDVVPTETLRTLAGMIEGEVPNTPEPNNSGSNLVAEDFCARGDIEPVLIQHGWTLKSESDQQYWYRPGKSTGSHSATFNDEVFYLFSSNAAPFEVNQGYSRFGVYAMLEHDGNFAAATRSLEMQGFGPPTNDVDLSGIMAQFGQNSPDVATDVYQPTQHASVADRPPPGDEIEIRPIADLFDEFTGLNQPILHGLLREGETMNVIASPKVGKSWFSMRMIISVVTGLEWMGMEVEAGRVLHIDNELHSNTLSYRYNKLCDSLGISTALLHDRLDTITLRGGLKDLHEIGHRLMTVKPGDYQLIVIDALYRTLPAGVDENDNGAMAGIYNMLDRHAARLGCAFVLIHHSSKGNQAGKAVTDVGAGAGSQSRAVDSHMVIRPHEEEGMFVIEAASRSWPPLARIAVKFDWPLFEPADEVDTSALMGGKKEKKREVAVDLKEFVAKCIEPHEPCSKNRVQIAGEDVFGLSARKAVWLCDAAIEDGLVARIKANRGMKLVINRYPGASDAALWIAAILATEPGIAVPELVHRTGISRSRVYRAIDEINQNEV